MNNSALFTTDCFKMSFFEGLNKSEAGSCGGKEVNSYKGFLKPGKNSYTVLTAKKNKNLGSHFNTFAQFSTIIFSNDNNVFIKCTFFSRSDTCHCRWTAQRIAQDSQPP